MSNGMQGVVRFDRVTVADTDKLQIIHDKFNVADVIGETQGEDAKSEYLDRITLEPGFGVEVICARGLDAVLSPTLRREDGVLWGGFDVANTSEALGVMWGMEHLIAAAGLLGGIASQGIIEVRFCIKPNEESEAFVYDVNDYFSAPPSSWQIEE